jgi:hypothetical protein
MYVPSALTALTMHALEPGADGGGRECGECGLRLSGAVVDQGGLVVPIYHVLAFEKGEYPGDDRLQELRDLGVRERRQRVEDDSCVIGS